MGVGLGESRPREPPARLLGEAFLQVRRRRVQQADRFRPLAGIRVEFGE